MEAFTLSEVKALTLIQPWATFVAEGVKQFETRSWKTSYRGPLAIHAGMKDMGVGFGLPRGCIVAIADLQDCIPTAQVTVGDVERGVGDFRPGRYAWQLGNVVKLPEPFPISGMQGLWNVPADVARRLFNLTALTAPGDQLTIETAR